MPDFSFEDQYPAPVAGVDEVGRGPWAGPVIAAAVILDPARVPDGLDDSKKLTARRRETLFDALTVSAQIGYGEASVDEIDRVNIVQATFLAMRRAVEALPVVPGHLLIDGNLMPKGLSIPATTIVKGDARSLSIAAASVVAKVTRDRLMSDLGAAFPGYEWHKNAGYGTRAHIAALKRLGVTPHHRRSFKPIHNMLCNT